VTLVETVEVGDTPHLWIYEVSRAVSAPTTP
jgi:hypothetical protein